MSLRIDQHCKHRACRAPIRLARVEATGAWFALNAAAVPAGTRGALVLIGAVAFSEPSAVGRIADMFAVDDATAHLILRTDYGWHLPHKVTCQGRAS